MRDAFFKTLVDLAESDERVMFLTGDLGFKLFDPFSTKFPERFLNMGVSEANMVSVAAGLALSGRRPFVYSIVPFVTARCLEQMRDDVCLMNAPVVVVGVGGGYAYGENGPTHHGIDDIALMRVLPGMTVVCPCDPRETSAAMRALLAHDAPAYLRLGRAGEPTLEGTDQPLILGEPTILRQGSEVVLLSTGQIVAEVLRAADMLQAKHVEAEVVSVHTVKPLNGLARYLGSRKPVCVVVIEEHLASGGFSEAVAAIVAQMESPPRFIAMTAPDKFTHEVGSQTDLRKLAGLDAQSIADRVLSIVDHARC